MDSSSGQRHSYSVSYGHGRGQKYGHGQGHGHAAPSAPQYSDTQESISPYQLPPLTGSQAGASSSKGITSTEESRRKQTEKKRIWRQSRSPQQLTDIRQHDKERKRSKRDSMTPEQKRVEREKDAKRKALKRQKEKEQRQSAKLAAPEQYPKNSIQRILN